MKTYQFQIGETLEQPRIEPCEDLTPGVRLQVRVDMSAPWTPEDAYSALLAVVWCFLEQLTSVRDSQQ